MADSAENDIDMLGLQKVQDEKVGKYDLENDDE